MTWQAADGEELTTDLVLQWRQEMAEGYYGGGHETQSDPLELRSFAASDVEGIEARGIWHGIVGGQPHAGPFLTRVVHCPGQNRRYLLDAWLFAPDRGKYRYLIQLETLLDSFGCPSGQVPDR